jgi:hypothetical protein
MTRRGNQRGTILDDASPDDSADMAKKIAAATLAWR